MDPVLGAGAVRLPGVHQELRTASSGSQTFSQITASGNSRIQNGNSYYVTYNCSVEHDLLPMLQNDTYQHATARDFARPLQKRKRSVGDVSDDTRDKRERQTLSTVLESLGRYSKSIQQQSEGEQSRKIAAQLMVILEAFEQVGPDADMTEDVDRRVRDLKDQLCRARRIKINAASLLTQTSRIQKAVSEFASISFGDWEISLHTKTSQSSSFDGETLAQTCSALRVQPAHSSTGSCISAFFKESIDVDQTVVMHPVVLAYNQIKSGAKVFKLVEADDLNGLMEHLALGKASIRDCDEMGRPLLRVSKCFYSDA